MPPCPVKGVKGDFFMFNLKVITCCLPVFASAFISYYATSSYYQLQIAKGEKKMADAVNVALVNKGKKEKQFNETLSDVQSSINLDIKNLTLTYDKYRDNGGVADTDGVHTDTADSSGHMPQSSQPTNSISQSKCQCNGIDRTKFQKLYQQQLVIARDCDITATYYNRLIDLYMEIQQ